MVHMEVDEYHTISGTVESETKIKGSRFLATATPVSNPNEAENFYAECARLYSNATHNCFAYKLGVGDLSRWRSSDDGEPAGTAGNPILQAIESRDLTNIIVVVTRYFGGTKLGIGGLIRAYGSSAVDVLNHAVTVKKYITVAFDLVFPYNMTNAVMKQVANCNGRIIKSSYNTEPKLTIVVRKSLADVFRLGIVESTAGRALITELGN